MKKVTLLLLSCMVLNCSKNPEQYIQFIEGYWEIDEVMLTDGSKKVYDYNDTIDYITMNDSLIGFRKKLKPNFSGTYETSNDAEQLKLKIENDSLHIYYTTPYLQWKETVLSASENHLLIINDAKVRYLYKRYQPLDLSND